MPAENDDHPGADDQRGAPGAENPEPAATPTDDERAAEAAGGDVWQEATASTESPRGSGERPLEDAPPAGEETPPTGDLPPADEEPVAAAETAEPESPRLSAVPDDESPAEDPARQFINSVEGFLGNVFKDASDAMDKLTSKGRDQSRGTPPPAADPAQFMESVESWVGDFFRGAPGKAARGFGKAAAGSALRSATGNRNDDVWASATTEDSGRDASRECRYCPFCQTLAAVRNTRPELYDQIGDTAKTLVDLVKQAAEQSRGRRPWR